MTKTSRKRILIWGSIGVLLTLALAKALVPDPIPVDIATLSRGPLKVTLDHEGRTRLRNPFLVSAPVVARVRRIDLEPGDPVVASQTVLATLESTQPVLLDSRDQAERSAAVDGARSLLTQTRAEEGRAAAVADQAAADQARIERLAARQVVSQQALDQARSTAREARETLASARAAVSAAAHELERANARLAPPTRVARETSGARVLQVLSPVDGVVLRRFRQSAGVVAPGESLVEVGNPAELEVVADYLSTDAVRIRAGMAARVERWGGDAALQGVVRRVEPSGFTKVSALGVEEQRVNVIVDLTAAPAPRPALGDAYRVEVRVVVWERADALRIPTSSLFRSHGAWSAFVVRSGRARQAAVEIGQMNDEMGEVLSGVNEGAEVVIHPSEAVRDGARVNPRSR